MTKDTPNVIEATTGKVIAVIASVLGGMAAVVGVMTPLVLGAARNEAQSAVARQAEADRATYVTKAEMQAILRELDQVRHQLDRIEARVTPKDDK